MDPAYFVLGFIQEQGQDVALWLRYVQTVVDISWKIVSGGGVIVGGVWAYYKFIKGRTFRPNIVPKVAGEARNRDGAIFLIATTEVENVGASKVTIDHKHTVVRVLTSKALPRGEEGPIEWGEKPFATRKILQHRDDLEPGGTAVDTELFQIRAIFASDDELLRTPYTRSSENYPSTHLGE